MSNGDNHNFLDAVCRIPASVFLILCGLCYGSIVGLFLHHIGLDNMLRDLNLDDSFYYFKIASNMAHGEFSTFDGVNLTNGYHPLFVLMIMPVYWLFDPVPALWAIKVIETALLFGVFAFVALSLRNAGLPMVYSLPLLIGFVTKYWSGMETTAHMFVLSLGLWSLTKSSGPRMLFFCVFLALLPWVRLESISVGYLIIGVLAVLSFFSRELRVQRRELIKMTLVLTGSFLVYVTYNWIAFGILVPVSGLTKQQVLGPVIDRMDNLINAFSQGARYVASALLALGFWIFVIVKKQSSALWMCGLFLTACSMAAVVRVAYTGISVHVTQGMCGWYYVPAVFSGLACVSYVLALLHKFGAPQLALTLLAMACMGVGFSQIQRIRGFLADQHVDWEIASYRGTIWMNDNLPGGSVIASRDSGVVGYFSDHRVINVDGLVNSYDYLGAQKRDRRWEFLKRCKVGYYANLVRKTAGPRWTLDNASFTRIHECPIDYGDHSDWSFAVFKLDSER